YAKAQGIPCVLEQIHAPLDIMYGLLREETERWPGWEPGLHLEDSEGVLERRGRVGGELTGLMLAPPSFFSLRLPHPQKPRGQVPRHTFRCSLGAISLCRAATLFGFAETPRPVRWGGRVAQGGTLSLRSAAAFAYPLYRG